jgi:hypothetical protein
VPGPCGREPFGSQASGTSPVPHIASRRRRRGEPFRYAQLVSEIADWVYKDDNVAEIDFYLGISEKRIHITGAGIAKIATLLEAGKFALEVDDAKIPKGLGALYIRKERKFVFGSGIVYSQEEIEEMADHMRGSLFRDEPLARGLVVHEFVHAVLDLEGRAIVELSDEAAAYLAETLYHVRRDSRGLNTYKVYHENARDEWHSRIIEVARDLITEHRLDSKGKHLNWLQYRALRKAIHAHPAYRHLGPIERG